MNKTIVFLLSVLMGGLGYSQNGPKQKIDCNKFHEKNIIDIAVRLPLKKKIQTADKYILEVKSDDGVRQIFLLRNEANRELFDYLIENDVLSKKLGEKEIRVARFDTQGNIFVRPFTKFCP